MKSASDNKISPRGISPLVASVLTIAITIAVATLVIGWITNVTKDTTSSVGNSTDKTVDCTSAKLSIEEVYLDAAGNRTRISVKNSGYIDDVIVSGTVTNNLGVNAVNITEFPVTLLKGDYATLEFNTTLSVPDCSNFSKATVATRCKSAVFDSSPKNC